MESRDNCAGNDEFSSEEEQLERCKSYLQKIKPIIEELLKDKSD